MLPAANPHNISGLPNPNARSGSEGNIWHNQLAKELGHARSESWRNAPIQCNCRVLKGIHDRKSLALPQFFVLSSTCGGDRVNRVLKEAGSTLQEGAQEVCARLARDQMWKRLLIWSVPFLILNFYQGDGFVVDVLLHLLLRCVVLMRSDVFASRVANCFEIARFLRRVSRCELERASSLPWWSHR